MMEFRLLKPVQYFLLSAAILPHGCGWFDTGPAAANDGNENAEIVDSVDMDMLPDRIEGNDDQIPEAGDVDVIQPDFPPDVPGDDAPDAPPSGCGNGLFEPGEACDDLNTVTEPCGMGTECLGDCSMLEATCGNAAHDPGERCDDGNTNSMDLCTMSCTANDNNIGAPCTCLGNGCSDWDLTAGTIQGCDNVEVPPGSGGVLACLRTPSWSQPFHYAEGYCSLLAAVCEGGGLCSMVPPVGDMDTFACPAGYIEHSDTFDVLGITVTYKVCLQTCRSPSQCRWNAKEASNGECGGMDCIPLPEDPAIRVCNDPRNFPATP